MGFISRKVKASIIEIVPKHLASARVPCVSLKIQHVLGT